MKMIIGGAYQGKLVYAKERYPEITWIDGATCKEEELYTCEGIYHFHKYIERLLRQGKNLDSLAKELFQKNPEIILVTDEIGYGIVPMDAFDRNYREKTGRICTELAGYSTQVTRIVCGIPSILKGE